MNRKGTLALGLAVFAGMVGLLFSGPPGAHAGRHWQDQDRPLRVAIRPIVPFVMKQGDQWAGFSIDLWDAVANRLNLDYTWVEVQSDSEMMDAVASGAADVAISALAMTPEREQAVDFTVPYFDSGLQIMVRAENDRPLLNAIKSLLSPAILQFVGVALVIVFVLANVLWLSERRSNPKFQRRYGRSLVEGLWGVMLIIATGEYGDRDVPNAVKRLMVAAMWLFGVVLVAQFTATVTSSLTVQQLQSSIQGPSDLPGKTIATAPGSIAAAYLTQLGLPYVEVTDGEEAYKMITQGQVQAIVFDAPTLQYWAAKRGQGVLQLVGPVFRPVKYGIAVADGSPLRKKLNQAMLTLYQEGTYEDIYGKWFAQGK